MPREIIPGEDDSPYALRSDLGWGIIGKISQPLNGEDGNEDEMGVSHRVYTIEACEPLALEYMKKDSTREVAISL